MKYFNPLPILYERRRKCKHPYKFDISSSLLNIWTSLTQKAQSSEAVEIVEWEMGMALSVVIEVPEQKEGEERKEREEGRGIVDEEGDDKEMQKRVNPIAQRRKMCNPH
ncbi:hypothetical protein WR25_23993 [Diploscapter pachys]|uniref:Uncharacterized protein n=1 Tax=Diploscapter pachys TaxID=2018661 RepID=A0A2A2L0A2_9BILA|nr:hypothetical protein WR25_23993 [Diploscapter pachys]